MTIIPPLLVFILLPLIGFSGVAQSEEEPEWEFSIVFPMIWVAEINGEIEVSDRNIDASKSFADKIDTLEFGFMGEFYAQRGPWRYAFKLNYEKAQDNFVSDAIIVPPGIPLVPRQKFETDFEQGTSDAIVGYQLDGDFTVFTGVRYIFSEINAKVTPLEEGIIELEGNFNVADENLYDWLVGAEYQVQLAPRWNFLLHGDVAIAGDNDRDYSGNVMVTYRISELNNVRFGYRYLRIMDRTTEGDLSIKSDFVTKGPEIGWAFTF